jgi:hypothetical protein
MPSSVFTTVDQPLALIPVTPGRVSFRRISKVAPAPVPQSTSASTSHTSNSSSLNSTPRVTIAGTQSLKLPKTPDTQTTRSRRALSQDFTTIQVAGTSIPPAPMSYTSAFSAAEFSSHDEANNTLDMIAQNKMSIWNNNVDDHSSDEDQQDPRIPTTLQMLTAHMPRAGDEKKEEGEHARKSSSGGHKHSRKSSTGSSGHHRKSSHGGDGHGHSRKHSTGGHSRKHSSGGDKSGDENIVVIIVNHQLKMDMDIIVNHRLMMDMDIIVNPHLDIIIVNRPRIYIMISIKQENNHHHVRNLLQH